jgi:hypothetical protein
MNLEKNLEIKQTNLPHVKNQLRGNCKRVCRKKGTWRVLKNRNKLRYGSDQIKDFNLSH